MPLPDCPCGAPAVVFDPGDEPEVVDLFSHTMRVSRGRPSSGRCWKCFYGEVENVAN